MFENLTNLTSSTGRRPAESISRYVASRHTARRGGGIPAAQLIKPQDKVLANDRGISCVRIDYDLLRGLDSADNRLF